MGISIKKAEALTVVNKIDSEEIPLSDLQKQLKEYAAAMAAKDTTRALQIQMNTFKTAITSIAAAICMGIGLLATKLIGLF